jgi:hypothetical protein
MLAPQRIISVALWARRGTMDQEEQRDTPGEEQEDPRDFEGVGREVREGQSPSVGEEGTEEERGQWEKTRDLHEEAKQVTEKADARHRRGEGEDHDHS